MTATGVPVDIIIPDDKLLNYLCLVRKTISPNSLVPLDITYTISKSKCYTRFKTCNELHYYEPPILVTYGLRISIRL